MHMYLTKKVYGTEIKTTKQIVMKVCKVHWLFLKGFPSGICPRVGMYKPESILTPANLIHNAHPICWSFCFLFFFLLNHEQHE